MRGKNDLKSLTGKRPRGNRTDVCLTRLPAAAPLSPGASDDFVQARSEAGSERQRDSLLRQQDLLCNKIKQGKEYLRRVQKELNESRASLEQWNRYELISSAYPLDHLIQTASLQEKTRQFLVGWLERQQKSLAKVREHIDSLPGNRAAEGS